MRKLKLASTLTRPQRNAYRQTVLFTFSTFFLLFIGHVIHANAQEENQRTEQQLERAKEEASSNITPSSDALLGDIKVHISPQETTATSNEPLVLSVRVERAFTEGVVTFSLPPNWRTLYLNGLKTVRNIKTDLTGSLKARFIHDDRKLTIAMKNAEPGSIATIQINHQGIPAGKQRFQVVWQQRLKQRKATLSAIFYAPTREGEAEEKDKGKEEREQKRDQRKPQRPSKEEEPRVGVPTNTSKSNGEHPEAVGIVTPNNPLRVVTAANSIGEKSAVFLSNNGGKNWQTQPVPHRFTTPNSSALTNLEPSGDPILAANTTGDIWYGEITKNTQQDGLKPIVINRIPAGGNSFTPTGAALPTRTNGQQDKPAITIDNTPTSPTFGRLYVAWNEPGSGGGIRIVFSSCDTQPNPANCDNAKNWTTPTPVTTEEGSYMYADVGVDTQGKIYLTWWDYSSANAIRGATCQPGFNCLASQNWSTKTIATLNTAGGQPVPFACPTLAQPGGRAAPAPQIAIDTSNASTRDNVYVVWSDLRTKSGLTRCSDSKLPRKSHLTWDTFLATASGDLPGSGGRSTSVAQQLSDDSTAQSRNADDWFASVAVDQTTGDVWAGFYSTRADKKRREAHYYIRQLSTEKTTLWVSPLIRVSKEASDYSNEPCCQFGNDYGDYSEISATSGYVFPVWTGKTRDGLGQIFTAPLRRMDQSSSSLPTT